MPAAGKLVLSVIPQFANFSHTLIGTQGVSSQQVVATTPWYWNPAQKLRLVPQNTAVATQSVALAYGVTKAISVVLTTGMIEENLDMLTFKGASGITPLGMSFTGTGGMTDTSLAAVSRVYQDPINRIQFNLGMSFPTGSDHDTFTLLQPTGSYATSAPSTRCNRDRRRRPMPGVVYAGNLGKWSWGLSYRGRLPLAVNPEGWAFGDLHEFNAWGGYSWIPGLTTTIRVAGSVQGRIVGNDPLIFGKAQAANPNSTAVNASRCGEARRSPESSSAWSGSRCRSKAEFPFTKISTARSSRRTGRRAWPCGGR